jgi:uncharacterized protein (DUF1330 family)
MAEFASWNNFCVIVGADVVIGALALKGPHAQAPSARTLPAFYISEFEVTDSEGMKPYSARVASTFEPFVGRYIVRGGQITPLEGEAPQGRIVVIAFESMEKAQAWYDSPAYQELKPIRHKAATSRVFIVEGTAN